MAMPDQEQKLDAANAFLEEQRDERMTIVDNIDKLLDNKRYQI